MKKTAGSYDPMSGYIVNPIGNMRRQDAEDAFSTLIHEMQHLHFNLFTVIGGIIEVLRTEAGCTSESDEKHREMISEIMQILCGAFTGLQEIYANSLELLWIEEQQGADYAALVYGRKVKKYQDFCKKFSEITRECKSIEEKRNVIHKLCVKAAAPDITARQFVQMMQDKKKLEAYFAADGNLEKRLQTVMQEYKNTQTTGKSSITGKLWDIVQVMIEQGILKYSKELIEFSAQIVKSQSKDDLTEFMTGQYQDFLLKKTEVFNFDFLKNDMAAEYDPWKEDYFCVLKKHSRLLYPKNNFMLMGYSEKKGYISQEAAPDEMEEAVRHAKAVMIDYNEFNIRRNSPEYFTVKHCPLFVLITTYSECEMWMERIQEEDLYCVDLFEEENNFFTLFLFRRRTEPNIIFVYPALNYLVKQLIGRFELQGVMYSTDKEALKILAGFKGELEMLKAVIWLFTFVSGAEWDGFKLQMASSMLSMGFVRSLADSSFQLHGTDYWMYRSALPTERTASDGFYTLMQFKKGYNTGIICAQDHEGESYALFFRDREEALCYRRNYAAGEGFQVMGVDKYYWEILSSCLRKRSNKMCLYLNEEQAVLLDLDAYQSVVKMVR